MAKTGVCGGLAKSADTRGGLLPKTCSGGRLLLELLTKHAALLLLLWLVKSTSLLTEAACRLLPKSALLWSIHLAKATGRGRLIEASRFILIKAAAESVHVNLWWWLSSRLSVARFCGATRRRRIDA